MFFFLGYLWIRDEGNVLDISFDVIVLNCLRKFLEIDKFKKIVL